MSGKAASGDMLSGPKVLAQPARRPTGSGLNALLTGRRLVPDGHALVVGLTNDGVLTAYEPGAGPSPTGRRRTDLQHPVQSPRAASMSAHQRPRRATRNRQTAALDVKVWGWVIAKIEFTLSRVLLERQRAAMTYYDRDVSVWERA